MGTVRWKWKHDNIKAHYCDIKNILCFMQSPVNISGVTVLADQLNDDEETGIDTKWAKPCFYWDNNQYCCTILHPESRLPELCISEGFTVSRLYSKIIGAKVYLKKHHCQWYLSKTTPDDGDDKKEMLELSANILHIGETLLYTTAGQTCYVKVKNFQ